MKLATFAPHLQGRMLPGIFSYFIGKQERFPGDPWSYAHVRPSWYWMHTTACGTPNHIGSSKSWTIRPALLAPESAAFNPLQRPAAAPTPLEKPKRLELFSRSKSTTVAAQCELFAGVRE